MLYAQRGVVGKLIGGNISASAHTVLTLSVRNRPSVLLAAGERLDPFGSQAGKGRFLAILGHLAASETCVPEAILYLQSGHGQALPARAYMHLMSPARFLETFEAFGL